jgi:hypothetical protein
MSDEDDKRPPEAISDVEREIRQGRKFSPKEAMARLAGPGAMKGASPVSPVQQAETEIGNWLNRNLSDSGGALRIVIRRHLKGSQSLLEHVEQPLKALAAYCRSVLVSDYLVAEIVREADIEWGRSMEERPYFERQGSAPHPDDPYTSESVRKAMNDALEKLPAEIG